MPLDKINYKNIVIYKIQHIDNEEMLYVGHTTDFTKRKYLHRTTCTNPNLRLHNLKVYEMIRNNGGWDSFKMLEIKKYPCNDKREASAEEEISVIVGVMTFSKVSKLFLGTLIDVCSKFWFPTTTVAIRTLLKAVVDGDSPMARLL